MTSPGSGRPLEDSLAGPVGRGEVPPPEHFDQPAPLTILPDHLYTSERDLLAGVRNGDGLAFVELYQRTSPAAHAVSRRLLTTTSAVEAALRSVYAELWINPPPAGSLVQWIRARCFAVATADLRRRCAAPGEASLRTVLPDLPVPTVHHISQVERALIQMPEAHRLAVLLAHDAGVASSDQDNPEAGRCLEAALLELAAPGSLVDGFEPSCVDTLGDWVLGLLPEPRARAVAAAVAADAPMAARVATLQMGRRRLEGLPPSPNTSQRILGHVLASPHVAAPSAPEVPQPAVVTTAPSGARKGLSLVAASLALVLLAGVLVLTSRTPGRPQLAAAQAAAPPAETSGAPTPEPSPRVERQRRPRETTPRIVPPSRNRPTVKPVALPVRVAVPKMDVDKRLIGLGVLNDGTLAAPDDYGTPGWFQDGVAPGDLGPAVIVGHVDSESGPAVFFKLETLKRGDKAFVKRADGTTATFVIDRVERYAKDAFPTEQVYGPTLGPELRLITCGGAFDNTTLSYDDNVVAYAHLQQPRARSRKDRDRDRGGNERAREQKKDALPEYDHLGRLRKPSGQQERDRKADALPEYDHLGRLRKPSGQQGRDDKTRNRDSEPADTAADA